MADYLTLREIADELRVPVATVRSWVADGLATLRPGSETLVHRSALDPWVAALPDRPARKRPAVCVARAAAARARALAASDAMLDALPAVYADATHASVRTLSAAAGVSRRVGARAVGMLVASGELTRDDGALLWSGREDA